jgi:hypothetical protein
MSRKAICAVCAMQVIDCASGEVKARKISNYDAVALFEKLGGRRMGYCIAEDDEPIIKKDQPDEKGWLF